MGIKQNSQFTTTSAKTLALELEQVLDNRGFLGHQLRQVPVAVEPPPAEPRPALSPQERDRVASEGLGVAEAHWRGVSWVLLAVSDETWGV